MSANSLSDTPADQLLTLHDELGRQLDAEPDLEEQVQLLRRRAVIRQELARRWAELEMLKCR